MPQSIWTFDAGFNGLCNGSYHKHGTILRLLKDAGCSDDDVRLVRFLPAHTTLRVNINGETSAEFESTSGAFQGDCLSGILFTLTLAGALHHLRAVTSNTHQNHRLQILLCRWNGNRLCRLYRSEENLRQLLPICTEILKEWNLSVINESKTEFTNVYLADKNEVDSKGEPSRDQSLWIQALQ